MRGCEAERRITEESGQSAAESESGCGSAVLSPGLVENTQDMIGNGLLTEHQGFGYLAVTFAGDDEAQHLCLPLAESGRKRAYGTSRNLLWQVEQAGLQSLYLPA